MSHLPNVQQTLNVVSFPEGGSPPKLLDRVRYAIRTRHYSPRTEEAYVHWIRRYIVFHGKKHPSTLGAADISVFLTWLAVERKVSASTQNQAPERRAVSLQTRPRDRHRGGSTGCSCPYS